MARATKRKHTSMDDEPSTQTAQLSIKAFANVSKPNDADSGLKKRKTIHTRDATPPPVSISTNVEKKRKRGLEPVEEEADRSTPSSPGAPANTTPRRYKRTKNLQPAVTDTPSKSAVALFDKLNLETKPNAIPCSLNAIQRPYSTPPATPDGDNCTTAKMPAELQDLTQLYASFLSALSLYYSHNGTSSPVNVRALLPLITKSWKKRAVSLVDVQVLLSIGAESGFILKDFGRGGICLTKDLPRGRASKRAASYVDEVDLNLRFQISLQKDWNQWSNSTAKERPEVAAYLDQIQLAEIAKDESVEKAAPLFARGQQRLADLKASQINAKSEAATSSEVAAEHMATTTVQNRGTSLLDRILAKQALTASLPAAPTKHQLERRAALQRVEDIARVLDLLAGVRPRCSFSMQAVVQQLQQSLRNPISREEVERCLGLMANEITPGYVSIIQSGSVRGVVVTKARKVGLEEIRQRVQSAGA